jgi:hypothetical protein
MIPAFTACIYEYFITAQVARVQGSGFRKEVVAGD